MGNCTVADVATLIFPPGTRPTAADEDKIQQAIEDTAQTVSSGASYAELMAAKYANAEAAAAKLAEKPKPKTKAKATK